MSVAELMDLATTAAQATYGEAVSYTPQSTGVPEAITCPFTPLYVEMTIDGGIPHSAARPMIYVRHGDLTVAPLQGDAATVRALNYKVTDVRPGGHQSSRVFLVRAP